MKRFGLFAAGLMAIAVLATQLRVKLPKNPFHAELLFKDTEHELENLFNWRSDYVAAKAGEPGTSWTEVSNRTWRVSGIIHSTNGTIPWEGVVTRNENGHLRIFSLKAGDSPLPIRPQYQ